MKKSSFFKKTAILTSSNLLTGILTFGFSIILSREIGSKGMGLYQLVMPLYSLFLFVTGGGITVTISKIAAEKKASGKLNELYRTIKATCVFEVIWSSLITAIVVIMSGVISSSILSDKRTLYSILAFCPALMIISISSVLKGAYYGLQRVVEPALIDVAEKIARISVMYPLVMLVRNSGIEYSSACAVLSLSCGELVSCILFFICYRVYVRKNPGYGKSDNDFQLVFNVLKLAIPLALNGILQTIFSTLTTVLIPKRLQHAGIPYEEALSLLGKLQGMALTIAFFPTVITGAVNILVIPSISEAVTFRKDVVVNHRMNTALRVSAITAFSSAAILYAIPTRLGLTLYKDPAVGELLRLIAPGVPLVYIEITTFAILNGLGKQGSLLVNSLIISTFELILVYIFLGIPGLNIKGYVISFMTTAILAIALNYRVIKNSADFRLDFFGIVILPLGCAILVYLIITSLLMKTLSLPFIIIISYSMFIGVYLILRNLSINKKMQA